MKVFITPTEAAALLEKNTNNRNLSKSVVQRYASDMKAGRWTYNYTSILVSDDGVLLDGQHRLAAAVEAGVGFWTEIFYGVEGHVRQSLDQGRVRQVSTKLQELGYTDTARLAAMARGIAIFFKGGNDFKGGGVAVSDVTSHANIIQTVIDNEWLQGITGTAAKVSAKAHINSAVFAVLWYQFNNLSPEDNEHFWLRLVSDQGQYDGDPIYELKKRMVNARAKGVKLSDKEVTGLSIKAWNSYRAGEQIGFLRFAPGGARPEAMPEPV